MFLIFLPIILQIKQVKVDETSYSQLFYFYASLNFVKILVQILKVNNKNLKRENNPVKEIDFQSIFITIITRFLRPTRHLEHSNIKRV